MMMNSNSSSTTTNLFGGGHGGGVRKGAWSEEEDILLRECIEKYGEGKWSQVPLKAGLNRCRKSCRLRWLNYLSPNVKRGEFTSDEVDLLVRMHKLLGNRWTLIAGRLPGRTANDIKNYCHTHLKKMLLSKHQYHHTNNNKDHDQLLKAAAAADHDHENKIRPLLPKAIKVLNPISQTFSSRKIFFHEQQQHSEASSGGSTNSGSINNSTHPAASTAAHSEADHEENGEKETSDLLLLTSFSEELLDSFCGDDEEAAGDMELMKNIIINMEHWDDDCDLHLDDNLWRLLEIEKELIASP